MKKKLLAILCVAVMLCTSFTLVACDLKIDAFAKELETPIVTINAQGIASWQKIDNAKDYTCNVSGNTFETGSTAVQLTIGQTVSVRANGDGIRYRTSTWSTPKTFSSSSSGGGQGGQGEDVKIKLATPSVTISDDGLASWGAVAHADSYEYQIGTTTGSLTVTQIRLESGQSIIVRAIGSGDYANSDWSPLKKYESKVEVCEHVDEDGNGECDNCGIAMDGGCTHVDEDDNGVCDLCKDNLLVSLNLYAINDLHGMYYDSSDQPGVDELTTYLLDAQKDGNSLVLSSGDMWQGGSESNNTKGKVATEWLNYINCASMTLGNHEFDWSTDKIKMNASLAEFPILAINVFEHATNARASYCGASTVVELGGVKIGIIGAIGDCYSSISSSMCQDVYFKVGGELTSLVKNEANSLRASGVDYIVYSIHDGGNSSEMANWYDVSLSNGYVDLVFEAHSHQSYTFTDDYGVKHVQGGGYNKAVSEAVVSYNVVTDSNDTSVRVVSSSEYGSCAKDNTINEIFDKYRDEIGYPDEVIGYNSSKRYSDTIEQTVAQLYYDKGVELWGSRYQIVLGGGYLKTRNPYNLSKGDVTVRIIQTLLPFDNKVVLCSISGSMLKSKFFETSNKDYSIAYGTYGTQVKNNVSLSKTYYIVTDTYTSDYLKLTVLASMGDNTFARDLLCDYIRSGGYNS